VSDSDDTGQTVANEIKQSKQALDDAKTAREAGVSDAAVINRLYYAAFHIVQAVLYDRGFEPTSHGGVLSLYGSEIITEGDASRDDGRFLSKLSELRKQADYGYEALVEDMESLCNDSER
jgi:uncharacterized protein (UPF0332 family)